MTMDLVFRKGRARSAWAYMQSYLAMHSLLLYHLFLSLKTYPFQLNPLPHNPNFLTTLKKKGMKSFFPLYHNVYKAIDNVLEEV